MDLKNRLDAVVAAARENAAAVDAEARFPAEAVAALRASGLLGLTVPTEHGGLGAGPVEFVDVVRAIAAACGSTAMVYLMHVSAVMTVAAAPPTSQPDLVTRLAGGRALGTLAFSEPGSRSHFWAPVSQAKRSGDQVDLSAAKSWVTSAGYADVYVTSTLSADTVDAAGGIDLYAVSSAAGGATVTGSFQGMGLRGNASAPMQFDTVVDDGLRLGPAGGGFDLMVQTVMPWFNLGNAAVSHGLAAAAVDAAVRHVSRARLEHAGQVLADLATIRARVAQMCLRHEAAGSYLRRAAASIAAPDDTTPLYVLGVKALANDSALTITDDAMRVCGGAAFSHHLQVDRYFRDARAGHVMAPTADVLYDFYGRAVTGQPVFG
jgi:alkylation response protein AidB-like acyl-CoA dehydrogenase